MTDIYSPTSRPEGSFDNTLVPATVRYHPYGFPGDRTPPLGVVPAPDNITVEWISSRLSSMTSADYAVNKLFYDGDHWQSGVQWSGPTPEPGHRDRNKVMEIIRKGFVSRNCIKEVVNRQANGVLAREPAWHLSTRAPAASDSGLSQQEDELRQLGEAEFTVWWDRVNADQVLADVVRKALKGGRAAVRVYVPHGRLTASGTLPVRPGDLTAALTAIELHSPEPYDAGVVVDENTKQEYGVYVHRDEDGELRAELVYAPPNLDQNGLIDSERPPLTVIREIQPTTAPAAQQLLDAQGNPIPTTNATQVFVQQAAIDIGGLLTIYEIKLDQLITEQVRQLQRSVNKSYTMADHNVEMAGYLERTITNGMMPGHFEPDPNMPGRQRLVRDEYVTGGGAVNFVNGIPLYNQQGEFKGITDPNVIYRNPVGPEAFERSGRMFYAALLDECSQAHYLLAGSEYVSGESRIQSRAEYVQILRRVKRIVDAAGRWLIEVVLNMASYFAGQPRKFAPMRAVFDSRLMPGPATAEATRTAIELRSAGGLSREGLMERSDIDDVDAEIRRIENEAKAGVRPPQRSSGRPEDNLARTDAEDGDTTTGRTGPGRPRGGRNRRQQQRPASLTVPGEQNGAPS